MDSGGFNWALLNIVGPIILLLVIAWAMLRNRRSRKSGGDRNVDTEAATRRNYQAEDRAHRHESDDVP